MFNILPRPLRYWSWSALCGLAACTPPPHGPPDEPPPEVLRFEADPRPEGAAVWAEGEVLSDGRVAVKVWAKELGPVFGYAFRLRVDAQKAEWVDARGGEPDSLLGAAQAGSALYVSKRSPSLYLGGGTRWGPAAGERAWTAPVQWARVVLEPKGTGEFPVVLEGVSVRRVDGSSIPCAVAAGKVMVPGGAL